MQRRNGLIVAILACALVGWWLANPANTLPGPDPGRGTGIGACPLPPLVSHGAAPLQTDVPRNLTLPNVADARLTPLAGISLDARVLGREDYRLGREANFSPTDLALGWHRMRDDAVLDRLKISQSGRWYHYRWQDEPPLPVNEIIRSSANMHMVPASDVVAKALRRITPGQRVRINGWLVRIDADDGWHWKSSLRRDDSGGGACELVYVCEITSQ